MTVEPSGKATLTGHMVDVSLRMRGDHASGTITASPGDLYTVTLDLTADCQSCGEAVG